MTFGWRPHYSREWLDYIEKIGQLNVLFKLEHFLGFLILSFLSAPLHFR